MLYKRHSRHLSVHLTQFPGIKKGFSFRLWNLRRNSDDVSIFDDASNVLDDHLVLFHPRQTYIHKDALLPTGFERAANTFILPLNSFVETNTSNTSPQLWPPSLTSKCSASGNRCFKTSKIFNSVSVRASSESLLEYSLFYDFGGRKSHFKFTQ